MREEGEGHDVGLHLAWGVGSNLAEGENGARLGQGDNLLLHFFAFGCRALFGQAVDCRALKGSTVSVAVARQNLGADRHTIHCRGLGENSTPPESSECKPLNQGTKIEVSEYIFQQDSK